MLLCMGIQLFLVKHRKNASLLMEISEVTKTAKFLRIATAKFILIWSIEV